MSHIANLINRTYKIELTHVLLMFCGNVAQATENYDERFTSICNGLKDFNFNKAQFHAFRDRLSSFSQAGANEDQLSKLLNDIDQEVGKSVIARDAGVNRYLEKLLIGALGHPHQAIRDQSVVLLNVLYDGVDW